MYTQNDIIKHAAGSNYAPTSLQEKSVLKAQRPKTVRIIDYSQKKDSKGRLRNSPWCVKYYVNRKPVCEFYATRDEAKKRKAFLVFALNSGFDVEDVRRAILIAKNSGYSLTALAEAGVEHLAHNKSVGVDPHLIFSGCSVRVIARAKKNGARPATLAGYESSYRTLNAAFGDTPVALITQARVEAYLDSLVTAEGKPAAYATKRTLLTNIRMALEIGGIPYPFRGYRVRGHEPRVRFFTNDQVRAILSATPNNLRGTVAVMVFYGLRPETMSRLQPWQVNAEDGSITVFEDQTKDGYAHHQTTTLVLNDGAVSPGIPAVTFEWVKRYGFRPVPWSKLQIHLRKALSFWIPDGLRHTAATNYYALWGAAATSDLLTHKGDGLVKRHYAGLASKKAAAEFYNITPDSIPVSHLEDLPPSKCRRIAWPSDEKLSEMLQKNTQDEVAKLVGCSLPALRARCRGHKIARPGRGSWTPKLDDTGDAGTAAPAAA